MRQALGLAVFERHARRDLLRDFSHPGVFFYTLRRFSDRPGRRSDAEPPSRQCRPTLRSRSEPATGGVSPDATRNQGATPPGSPVLNPLLHRNALARRQPLQTTWPPSRVRQLRQGRATSLGGRNLSRAAGVPGRVTRRQINPTRLGAIIVFAKHFTGDARQRLGE